MSEVIGKVEGLEGKFVAKASDGTLREISNGDEIYKDEVVIGDKNNASDDSVVITLNNSAEISVLGTDKQLFDSSLYSPEFAENETVSEVESITAMLNDDALDEDVFDESNLNDVDEEDTAAGDEEESSSERESKFAEVNEAIVDINADLRERSFKDEGVFSDEEDEKDDDGELESEIITTDFSVEEPVEAQVEVQATASVQPTAPVQPTVTQSAEEDQEEESQPVAETQPAVEAQPATPAQPTVIQPIAEEEIEEEIETQAAAEAQAAQEAAEAQPEETEEEEAEEAAEEPEEEEPEELNDAPTLSVDSTATVAEDGSVNLTFAATDVDGTIVSTTATVDPAEGTVTVNDNGTITFTPATNFSGDATITTVTTDDDGATATQTSTVTVNAVADSPNLSMSVGDPEAVLIDFDTDGGRNANKIEALDYDSALSAQNGNNGTADNLIFMNINQSDISFGTDTSDKIMVITGQANGTNKNHASIDMGDGGDNVLIFTNHAPDKNCDITFADDGNNVVILPITKSEYEANISDYNIVNADGIYFSGSNDFIGDVSSVIAGYTYDITIDASLSDTDGSESLGAISVDNLPAGATISEFSVDSDGNTVATVSSPNELDAGALNSMTASVTATEANGDSSTATSSAQIEVDGTAEAETVDGTSADEVIDAKEGADTINAGAGDDNIVLDVNDTSIDGGEGLDTLVLEEDLNIDFSALDDTISNIETIDLSVGSQHITSLTTEDVLNITDTDNILRIDGDSSDTIDLNTTGDDAEWTLGDFKTDAETGATYQEVTGEVGGEAVAIEISTDIQIDQS